MQIKLIKLIRSLRLSKPFDKIIYFFVNIITGLKNIIIWFPVIYRDRNWDYDYMLEILHKKLELMEKHFQDDSSILDSRNTVNQIREAKEITKRLIENSYLNDLTEDISTEELSGIFEITNKRFKTNMDHPKYDDWERASELSERLRANDKKRLFEILHDNIENWWDCQILERARRF